MVIQQDRRENGEVSHTLDLGKNRRVGTSQDATRLKEERVRLGLTQEDLGRALQVTRTTVSRWERGDAPIANTRMVFLALDALKRAVSTPIFTAGALPTEQEDDAMDVSDPGDEGDPRAEASPTTTLADAFGLLWGAVERAAAGRARHALLGREILHLAYTAPHQGGLQSSHYHLCALRLRWAIAALCAADRATWEPVGLLLDAFVPRVVSAVRSSSYLALQSGAWPRDIPVTDPRALPGWPDADAPTSEEIGRWAAAAGYHHHWSERQWSRPGLTDTQYDLIVLAHRTYAYDAFDGASWADSGAPPPETMALMRADLRRVFLDASPTPLRRESPFSPEEIDAIVEAAIALRQKTDDDAGDDEGDVEQAFSAQAPLWFRAAVRSSEVSHNEPVAQGEGDASVDTNATDAGVFAVDSDVRLIDDAATAIDDGGVDERVNALYEDTLWAYRERYESGFWRLFDAGITAPDTATCLTYVNRFGEGVRGRWIPSCGLLAHDLAVSTIYRRVARPSGRAIVRIAQNALAGHPPMSLEWVGVRAAWGLVHPFPINTPHGLSPDEKGSLAWLAAINSLPEMIERYHAHG